MKKKQIRRFTRVELITVLTVCSIGIAFLTSSVTSAQTAAIEVQCQSNLRDLVKISQSYADDNAHYLYTFVAKRGSWAGHPKNAEGSPYIKYAADDKMFADLRYCPAVGKEPSAFASYGIAGDMGMIGSEPETPKTFRTSEIERPEEFFLFMEMNNFNRSVAGANCYRAWWLRKLPLYIMDDENGRFGYRHNQGMNVGTLAGGVEAVSYEKIADDETFISSRVYRDGMIGKRYF